MKKLLLSFLFILTTQSLFAKRKPPTLIPQIEFHDLVIKVVHWQYQNDLQNGGYIEARNKSNKLIWFRVLYKNNYKSAIETDIQDVFIKSVELHSSIPQLVITNENGSVYYLNPKNGNSIEQ